MSSALSTFCVLRTWAGVRARVRARARARVRAWVRARARARVRVRVRARVGLRVRASDRVGVLWPYFLRLSSYDDGTY